MSVAIFGGGVAGLAAANVLRRQLGGQARVYERRTAQTGGGLGFILSAQALADLVTVGLRPAATRLGVELGAFHHYSPDGVLRHTQQMPAGWRAVRRADLVSALRGVLPAGTVNTGTALRELQFHPPGTVAEAVVVGTSGRERRVRAGLYIAADGARSVARRTLHPGWPERAARVWEVVALARHPGVRAWAGCDFHKFSRPGLAAGLVPVDGESVVWFIQFDRERFPVPDSADPAAALAHRLVADWAHPLPALVRATDFQQAHLWRPVDTDLPPRLYSGNLALVGDAAHPLLPFTSQGVAAALAGVRDLAAALATHGSVAAALAAYSASCRRRCAPYVTRGRELTRQFLQPDGRAEKLLPVST